MTQLGMIIGNRYRLDALIAAGGVGQVWRASDLLLERPVAVKLLRPEYAGHPETLERFRKEARHAGAVSHPCVAQVYDYGHEGTGGPPYLVMELVDGQSLADLLDRGPVEPAFALDVIAQAASGLHAAHKIGLVHRDVKPGNILIAADGQVKIADFGIASAAGQARVTIPGLIMGTTYYMAPERIAGSPGTPASDVYALGIVLHECLTGVPPYDGVPADVMAAHMYLPLPPLPASAPPELDALVAKLTDKDPARRVGDALQASELAAGVRDALTTRQLVPPAREAAMASSAWPGPAEPGSGEAGSAESGSREAGSPAPAGGGELPRRAAPGPDAGKDLQAGKDPQAGEGAAPPRLVPRWLTRPGSRRAAKVSLTAAAAVLLAVAALAAVLGSGALNGRPAANPGPASATPDGTPAPRTVPATTAPAATRTAGPGDAGTPTGQGGADATPVASPGPGHGTRPPAATPSASRSATTAPATRSAPAASTAPASSGPASSSTPSSTAGGSSGAPAPGDTPTSAPATPSATPSPTSPCLLGIVCI